MVLKLGYFERQIRNAWKVLKCGAGEEWRIKRRKASLIGHILRRNCLLKHIIKGNIEGGIEVVGRQRRRCKQLLYDLQESRGYCK